MLSNKEHQLRAGTVQTQHVENSIPPFLITAQSLGLLLSQPTVTARMVTQPKMCLAQTPLDKSFSQRWHALAREEQALARRGMRIRSDQNIIFNPALAQREAALQAEARRWLRAHIVDSSPLAKLPIDDMKHPERLVCFIQQMAVFRAECPSQTLSLASWFVGDALLLADRSDPNALIWLIDLAVAFEDKYRTDTEQKRFACWFKDWKDVYGLLNCPFFDPEDPAVLLERMEGSARKLDGLRGIFPSLAPRGYELAHYDALNMEAMDAFVAFVRSHYPDVYLVAPTNILDTIAILRGRAHASQNEHPIFDGWKILLALCDAVSDPNQHTGILAILNALLTEGEHRQIDFSWLGAVGSPQSLHIFSRGQVLSADSYDALQPFVDMPQTPQSDDIFRACAMLQVYGHADGLFESQKTIFRQSLKALSEALGRKLRLSETSYILEALKKHLVSENALGAKAYRKRMMAWLFQIAWIKDLDSSLLHSYSLSDFSLVLQSLENARRCAASLPADVNAYFQQQGSGQERRSDQNASYVEYSVQTASASGSDNAGYRLRLLNLYECLQNGSLQSLLEQGVTQMNATPEPLDEAGGWIFFTRNIPEATSAEVGEGSFIGLSEGDKAGHYVSKQSVTGYHLSVHFHPTASMSDNGGSAAGPSFGYSGHGQLNADLGVARRRGDNHIVVTLFGQGIVNIDYYDATGLVVDLGRFEL